MSLIASLTSGVSALKTFSSAMSTIGDNIANSNTTGFKASKARTEDSFSQTLRASTDRNSTIQVGSGVSIATIRQNFTQGSLTTTGVSTDFGLAGGGFFRVVAAPTDPTAASDPAAEKFYTRDGNFRADANRFLVNPQGHRVQGVLTSAASVVPIAATAVDVKLGATKPATTNINANLQSFSVGADGKITEFYSDGTSNEGDAAQQSLILWTFKDNTSLERATGNLYKTPKSTLFVQENGLQADTGGAGQVKQGTLELSNVDLAQEFSDLILAQRSFQAGSRIISVSDSVLEEVVNLKR